MKRRTLLAAVLLATGAITAQAAEMTLYENAGLSGRQLTVRGYMPDINTFGFNDHNGSIVVRSGTWEVCADAHFRGFCATLQPGEYRSLDTRFNERIASAREVGAPVASGVYDQSRHPGYQPPPAYQGSYTSPPTAYVPTEAPRIVLYDRGNFRGRSLVLSNNLEDLRRSNFNDDTASLTIEAGTWEVCTDTYFRGQCRVLQPGQYGRLDSVLNRSISSIRLAASEPPYRVPSTASVELFEGNNFDGRRFSAGRDMPNLDPRGFNDRASSMIIHEGQWEVCSDSGFNGRCRVFGPGRYTDLGRLNNEVSSLRRLN